MTADQRIATRSDLARWIEADLRMHGVDRWRAHFRLTRGVLYFQRMLRQAEYWTAPERGAPGKVIGVVLKVRLRRLSERLGFEVPRNVFGPGLSIAHSGLLVVSDDTIIGARCRIHHGVTLGAGAGGAPRLGNDVFLGPNAVVIGPVTIGDNAFIFPGAVCVADVPAGHSARGVPATVQPHSFEPWRPEGYTLGGAGAEIR